jgi:hypothetical protein
MSDEITEPVAAPLVDALPVPDPAPVAESDRDTDTERTPTLAELKAAKKEAQQLRAKLREIEASATDATTQLSSTRERLASLEVEVRGHRLHAAISAEAAKDEALRGLDPALAAKLIEGVEWSDDGKPKGIGASLKALVTTYPQLVASAGPRLAPQGSAVAPVVTGLSNEQLIEQKRRSGMYPAL